MRLIISFFLLLLIVAPSGLYAETFYFKKDSGVHVYTNMNPKKKGYKKFRSKWAREKKSTYKKSSKLGSYKYSDKYDHLIELAAEQYGIDAKLLKAIIKVESNFHAGAVSPKGAMGVMQLMPKTAERLGVDHPFDPMDNIFGGSKYYRKLLNMFNNDHELALAGYNAGENAVIKYGYNIPPYKETQNYVKKVFRHYKKLKGQKLKPDIQKLVVAKQELVKKEEPTKEQSKNSISYKETLDSVEVNRAPKKSKVIVESVEYKQTKSKSVKYKESLNIDRPILKVESNISRKTFTNNNSGSYTVQIASFPHFPSAKEMEESLKSKTYPAYIKEADIPNKGRYYRVRIGEFNSKNEALLFAENLKKEQPYIKTALVTTN